MASPTKHETAPSQEQMLPIPQRETLSNLKPKCLSASHDCLPQICANFEKLHPRGLSLREDDTAHQSSLPTVVSEQDTGENGLKPPRFNSSDPISIPVPSTHRNKYSPIRQLRSGACNFLPTRLASTHSTGTDSGCFSIVRNNRGNSTNDAHKDNCCHPRAHHTPRSRPRSAPPLQASSPRNSNALIHTAISCDGISKILIVGSPEEELDEPLYPCLVSSPEGETSEFSASDGSVGLAFSPAISIIDESQEPDTEEPELERPDSPVSIGRLELVLPDSDDSNSDLLHSSNEDEDIPSTVPLLPSDDEHVSSAGNQQPLLPATIFDEDLPEKSAGNVGENSFWAKNQTVKGPKSRLQFEVDVKHPAANPHKPIVFRDPVYDKRQPLLVRHPGRARVGDGNDTTANPDKLMKIGNDLQIEREKMASLGDHSKNRKARMRCSSRICRLKRLAQHEANKIKMAGLEREREELSSVITNVKDKMKQDFVPGEGFLGYLNSIREERMRTSVAGHTEDYVKAVMQSVDESPLHWASDSD